MCQFMQVDVKIFCYSGSDVIDWISLGTHSLNLQTWEHSCVSLDMTSGIVKVNAPTSYSLKSHTI